MTPTRSFTVTESIQAPASAIFPMLTDQDKLVTWFPSRAETDPTIGGNFRFSFEFLDPAQSEGKCTVREGAYLEITPNGRLRYSWSAEETEVLIELSERDGSTELALTHSGWKSEKLFAEHKDGWKYFLGNLKSVLEEGLDSRFSTMGMLSKSQIEAA